MQFESIVYKLVLPVLVRQFVDLINHFAVAVPLATALLEQKSLVLELRLKVSHQLLKLTDLLISLGDFSIQMLDDVHCILVLELHVFDVLDGEPIL